ncbi:putative neutral ceramidase C [Grus japonensis]|uniref:Neutral ceramidase n=1 Tax=Grus japonensis TaxID=30415 RepID=A0ABC9X4H9_GRUJA
MPRLESEKGRKENRNIRFVASRKLDPSEATANYLLGVGRADCTGPVAEIPLMGYANPGQVGGGLLMRLYSRAFIVADLDDSKRVVFVSADIGMVSQRLRLEVLEKLKSKYGDLYRQDNVILSGTHTHSGPGGYFQYTLFWITSKGLIRPSLNAIVNGIVKSIDIAHQNMKKGKLFINRGTVENSQMNRSPFSYLENPASERSRYSSNTDKEMVMLKMVDENGQDLGLISWFAVHPVSMNNTNHLVNSDNVGYASYLFEQDKNKGMLPGEATMCMAMGPGNDMFDSTRIIGQNIYLKAKELYKKASQEVTGPLISAHQWVNMSDVSVELNATHTEFDSHGTPRMDVVIAGLCNVYTHYITTYEEYQVQRYEAASTIYGPHTLSAYIQLYRGLARAIAKTEHNFLMVERYASTSDSWDVVQNDASWDTRFYWTKGLLGRSNVTVEWHIPHGTEPGVYRIRYLGHYKKKLSNTHTFSVPFEGTSSAFEITTQ